MYCITRTRKDGSIVNAIAAQVVADIKAIGDSSSTDQEKTNNSDWTNDDLSKVKGPERRGAVRCTGKFLVRNDKRSHDPQVPLLKAKVNYLQKGFMMFAAAVHEQVPNLNLSSVMEFMNMEADGLSSIHDNTIDQNPSSASGMSHLFNKESIIQTSSLKKSVSTADKSGVRDIPINISGVNHHHTSGNKLVECGSLNKSGNKSVVRDTPNNTRTSRFNTSGNKSARDTLNKSAVVRDTPNNSSTSRFNTSGKKKPS